MQTKNSAFLSSPQEIPSDWPDDFDFFDYADEDEESAGILIEEVDPDDEDFSDNGSARQ
jgi:hypothetical protein